MKRFLVLALLTTPAAAQDIAPIHDVLSHPRCANCHVDAEGILLWSTEDGGTEPHGMHIRGGESRMGIETLPSATCHGAGNNPLPGGAPGEEGWALAPVEMQCAARSAREICEQQKDPEQNGGRTLAEVADHVGHDPLVLWGWAPGPGREPAPGTPQEAAAAILAWAEAGAPCL